MAEGAAPSTPLAGTHLAYVATDGVWHIINPAGSDRALMTTDATPTIADGAIVNADLANMAEATVKGRAAGAGTGVPVDLTAAQLVTMLESEVASLLPAEADWQNLPLDATYTAAATAISGHPFPVLQYCSLGGMVMLRGGIKNLTPGGFITFGTLPEGFRPEYDGAYLTVRKATSFAPSFLVISSAGVLSSVSTTDHFLDGICFVPA
jgi:hypothetical protein